MEPLPVIEDIASEPEAEQRGTPPSARARAGLALLVVLLLIAGGAAVAFRGETRSPDEVIAAVPAAAADVRTMAMETHMSIAGPFKIETTAKGVFDLDTGDSRIEIGIGTRSMEMRTVDGTIYMKTREDGEERWVASPVPEGGDANHMLQTDPTAYLDLVKAVSSEVEEVGTEEVRGVGTTHYRFEIDPERVEAPGGQFSISDLGAAGIDTLPLDVWVDDDDLPRRMRLALGGNTGDIEIDVEMYDYGEPVDVEAPPDELVRRTDSADELMGEPGRTSNDQPAA